MSYLIDSDYLIDGLNGHIQALGTLQQLNPSGESISIVTLGELYEGAMHRTNHTEQIASIRRFLSGYDVLALSDEIMETFARLRSDLRGNGTLIPDFDLLIAATAINFDLSLVTRNLRHFERIAGLNIYTGQSD